MQDREALQVKNGCFCKSDMVIYARNKYMQGILYK